jgi:hypothetical protein
MEKQTAMQSLLVLLEMAGSRAEMVHVESLIGTIKASYLNLEKEQIKIAFNDGRTWNNSWRSEEYFEELYSKENDKEN